MHDNASIHRAHIIKDLLKDLSQEYGFTIMNWPPYSPDLNPVENLWALLKKEIYKAYLVSEESINLSQLIGLTTLLTKQGYLLY
jgi:transposase